MRWSTVLIPAEPLVFSSLPLALMVLCIVAAGTIVQAGLGMGFGLMTAPLLALIDPALVPGPTLYLGMATSLMGVFREPDGVDWGEVKLGALGRFIGVMIGAAALYNVTDQKTFILVFGIVIGGAVLMTSLGWQMAFTSRNLTSMSIISGAMGIFTSVGAPPMALLYSQRPAATARPTMAAFFAVGCALSLLGLNLSGWGGLKDLWLALFMVPGVVFGTLIGRRLKGRFDRRFRPILLGIAGLAAVMLIVRGLA